MKDRICDYCSRQYTPSNYNQRFCCASCKNCYASSRRIRESEAGTETNYEVNFSSLDTASVENLLNWGELLIQVLEAGIDKNLSLETRDFQLLRKLQREKKRRDLQ